MYHIEFFIGSVERKEEEKMRVNLNFIVWFDQELIPSLISFSCPPLLSSFHFFKSNIKDHPQIYNYLELNFLYYLAGTFTS